MKVLRTPDARFADLADYPFEPNYTNSGSGEGHHRPGTLRQPGFLNN
jgi:hypothetical protein